MGIPNIFAALSRRPPMGEMGDLANPSQMDKGQLARILMAVDKQEKAQEKAAQAENRAKETVLTTLIGGGKAKPTGLADYAEKPMPKTQSMRSQIGSTQQSADAFRTQAMGLPMPERGNPFSKKDLLPVLLALLAGKVLFRAKDRDLAQGLGGFVGGRQALSDQDYQDALRGRQAEQEELMTKAGILDRDAARQLQELGFQIDAEALQKKMDFDAQQSEMDRVSRERIAQMGAESRENVAGISLQGKLDANRVNMLKEFVKRASPEARAALYQAAVDPRADINLVEAIKQLTADEENKMASANLSNVKAEDIKATREARIAEIWKKGDLAAAKTEESKINAQYKGELMKWIEPNMRSTIAARDKNANANWLRANNQVERTLRTGTDADKTLASVEKVLLDLDEQEVQLQSEQALLRQRHDMLAKDRQLLIEQEKDTKNIDKALKEIADTMWKNQALLKAVEPKRQLWEKRKSEVQSKAPTAPVSPFGPGLKLQGSIGK